jgi:hypothetical protein
MYGHWRHVLNAHRRKLNRATGDDSPCQELLYLEAILLMAFMLTICLLKTTDCLHMYRCRQAQVQRWQLLQPLVGCFHRCDYHCGHKQQGAVMLDADCPAPPQRSKGTPSKGTNSGQS